LSKACNMSTSLFVLTVVVGIATGLLVAAWMLRV
jgi:hypothetical protein